MTPQTGQLLRRLGLLIETLSLLGLLSIYRKGVDPGKFAGFSVVQFMTAGIALGFALWLAGTITIYRRR
jgi:hypothetical protein